MTDIKTRMRAKIQKLFAMHNDSGASETEAETALRHAKILMEKYDIEMSELREEDLPDFEWTEGNVRQGPSPFYKNCKGWIGSLALPVGGFTDTLVSWARFDGDSRILFKGDVVDVERATWLMTHLITCVEVAAQTFVGGKAERTDFRRAMVSRLRERMNEMKEEANEHANQVSQGRSMVLVDKKIDERDKIFGKQRVRSTKVRAATNRAKSAGIKAGNNVGFGRPIANKSKALGYAG